MGWWPVRISVRVILRPPLLRPVQVSYTWMALKEPQDFIHMESTVRLPALSVLSFLYWRPLHSHQSDDM